MTHVVCSDKDLGVTTAGVGDMAYGEWLHIHRIHQHKNLMTGPFRELISVINQVPTGSVAHVHGCFSAFAELSMYMLSRRSIPFVFSPHGKLSPGMISTRGLSKRMMWHLATRHVVGGARLAGLFAEEESVNFERLRLKLPRVVIPNGYRKPERGVFSEPPLVAGDYILFLGFLDPRKQPSRLIESFAKSSAIGAHRLVFVGPDAYGHKQELEIIARSLGLGDKVLFYGPAFGKEKWNILANAACLCLPSKSEGMPLVLVEALGAATPTIFSRACNASDIAREGAGLELESTEADAWAEAIDRITSNFDMRHRMKFNASRIRDRYEWKTIARRWMDLYDSLKDENAQRSVS